MQTAHIINIHPFLPGSAPEREVGVAVRGWEWQEEEITGEMEMGKIREMEKMREREERKGEKEKTRAREKKKLASSPRQGDGLQ